MTPTYLTVAIPYVNAAPHLGYAYELVLADMAARARRASGGEVRFLGGTDDYALKNVLAAEVAGVPTASFVAAHAERFAALAGRLSVGFDDFIRTSADARHAPAVARLWSKVAAGGDLYRRSYTGDYCVGCERFYAAGELDAGRCTEHATPCERVEEENWFFRLSAYRDVLEDFIASGRLRITPDAYRAEALAFVRSGLEDLSVSRSAHRARGWGIPVPGDPGQVVYVWFDALTNYISALGYATPAHADYERWWAGAGERIHVVGKGILRFHAVYWPAFLASAGEPLPTRVHVHPYLSAAGAKLSKSSGVTLDPVAVAAEHGVDALRWWFARDVHATADTDFTAERLASRADEDLAGGVGNVVHRVTTLVRRYRSGVVPDLDAAPLPVTAGLVDSVRRAAGDLDPRRAARLVVDAVGALNRDLEAVAPWRWARDPAAAGDLDAVLARHVGTAGVIAEALAPLLPDLSRRLRDQLAGPGGRLGPPSHPYPRRRPGTVSAARS